MRAVGANSGIQKQHSISADRAPCFSRGALIISGRIVRFVRPGFGAAGATTAPESDGILSV